MRFRPHQTPKTRYHRPAAHALRRAVVGILVLALALASTTLVQTQPASALSSFDAQLLNYINNHRMSLGLNPLVEYGPLSAASFDWSQTMRNDSGSPCGSSGHRHDSAARIQANGLPPGWSNWGENIAFACGPPGVPFGTNWSYWRMPAACQGSLDYTTALFQFCQWVDSSGHRQAIENPGFTHIGVGSAWFTGNGVRSNFSTTRFATAPVQQYCNGLAATVDLVRGIGSPGNGADVIVGTPGPDSINGLGGNDTICGGGGNDVLDGGGGNDAIFGGFGDDTIRGGDGLDTINGQDGNDNIDGGNASDLIYGSTGNDTINGGAGWDTIQGNAGSDAINGQDGNDNINGGDGNDWIDGGRGHDLINGGDGADRLTGGSENDRINGQNHDDIINAGAGFDQIWGAYGNDTINGQDGNDWIWGGWGNDLVNGGNGSDRIYGEGHNDTLHGDAGWDHLDGGANFDACHGAGGTDTATRCESTTGTP